MLEYALAEETSTQDYMVGMRVLVPYRNKQVVGIIVIVGQRVSTGSYKIKPILKILDAEPLLNKKANHFLDKVAGYYATNASQVYPLIVY